MIVIETLNYINLSSTDLEKSKEFYTMFLDFDTISESEDNVILGFENLQLRLVKKDKAAGGSDLPLLSFIMDVDDFTDALQEIESRRVSIVDGPFEIPGGEAVVIEDPSKNKLEFYYEDN